MVFSVMLTFVKIIPLRLLKEAIAQNIPDEKPRYTQSHLWFRLFCD